VFHRGQVANRERVLYFAQELVYEAW
jgi:hypothetical protein